MGDLKTVWLLTSCCHHGGSHKPEFLIVVFPLHPAPKIALRSWKSPRAPFTMRTNIQPKGGSQRALVVNVLLKQSECTNPGCAYKILNSVAANHSTHLKITVPIVCYIINTFYKFQLMKRPTGCAVSLTRRGTYSSWCHYFFFSWTWPLFNVHKLTVHF